MEERYFLYTCTLILVNKFIIIIIITDSVRGLNVVKLTNFTTFIHLAIKREVTEKKEDRYDSPTYLAP